MSDCGVRCLNMQFFCILRLFVVLQINSLQSKGGGGGGCSKWPGRTPADSSFCSHADHDGLSGDEAQTVAPSVADLLQTTSSIEGQTFKDISGRSWRCSTQCLGRGGFGAVYLGIDEQV